MTGFKDRFFRNPKTAGRIGQQENGKIIDRHLQALLFISQVCFGIPYGLTTSLYTSCATYSEYRTGKNTKGFIMGLCSFSIKMSIVLRGLVITAGLGIIGYAADAAITAEIQNGITTMCFIIPAAFIGIAIIPLLFYRLSDQAVMEMDAGIAKRKKDAISSQTTDA